MSEEFYVIQVKKEGKTLYLKGTQASCFDLPECLVEDVSKAERFDSLNENFWGGRQLLSALDGFIYPGLICCSKSGIKIDEEPKIIKMQVKIEILGEVKL